MSTSATIINSWECTTLTSVTEARRAAAGLSRGWRAKGGSGDGFTLVVIEGGERPVVSYGYRLGRRCDLPTLAELPSWFTQAFGADVEIAGSEK
jgi:hypothetical protein